MLRGQSSLHHNKEGHCLSLIELPSSTTAPISEECDQGAYLCTRTIMVLGGRYFEICLEADVRSRRGANKRPLASLRMTVRKTVIEPGSTEGETGRAATEFSWQFLVRHMIMGLHQHAAMGLVRSGSGQPMALQTGGHYLPAYSVEYILSSSVLFSIPEGKHRPDQDGTSRVPVNCPPLGSHLVLVR